MTIGTSDAAAQLAAIRPPATGVPAIGMPEYLSLIHI